MNLLTAILAFAFALGSLIIVHEFGHYLAARLCNVKVLRFSVGFGRVLAGRRYGRDQTEWAISAFPIGGYVKMLDEREGEVAPHDLTRAFNRQSVYRRFVIVMAGPLANFCLAIFLYWLVFMHGMPGIRPVIGNVAPESAAAHAGFTPGEIIASIGEEKVATWQDARWMLLKHAVSNQSIRIEVHNPRGEISWRTLVTGGLTPEQLDSDFLAALGFLKQSDPIPSLLGQLTPGGAAERAGLQAGDEVVAVDGHPIRHWEELVKIIRDNPGKPITLGVRRGNNMLPGLQVTPDTEAAGGQKIGKAGIRNPYYVEVRYGPLPSLGLALMRTWDTSVFSLRMLGKMVMGEISLKNLSGPITIADYAGQSAQVGWIPYLIFLALISISLGVLNLLPIPLLDGGHLMYYMLEIAKGSPVSDKAIEIGQHVGMGVLLLLMGFALYNDITRLING
jgi:regulator of sigma E protease